MITLGAGLVNSLIVLEHLRNDRELADIPINVGCFTNCREEGLTFRIMTKRGQDSFTWCIYEHRNSDSIVINGKEGYISITDDLPYQGNKYEYLAAFTYGEHYKAAKKLSRLIQKFWKENGIKK